MWNMIGRRVAHIPKVNNKESKKFKNEVVGSLFVVVLGTGHGMYEHLCGGERVIGSWIEGAGKKVFGGLKW